MPFLFDMVAKTRFCNYRKYFMQKVFISTFSVIKVCVRSRGELKQAQGGNDEKDEESY